MKKKLTLNVDALAVASFSTAAGPAQAPGTVHGQGGDPPQYFDCTCHASCDCPSAYYWCGDGYHTIYSCAYTQNESCVVSKTCTS
ncbi:MAG TPA: hypothetical protein VEX86_19390 [Longimicrobium sp.]|nr:hypothetical protein [Longimicrobium sp.]